MSRKVFGVNAYNVFGKEESMSQNFKAGDRVRVTYDTVVTKSSGWSIGYVEVVSAIQIPVYSQGDNKWKTAQPTSLIPLENLTKLGPEADPTQTTRVKQGKEFLVAVKKPSYDPFQHPWVIVASYDGGRLGERFSNAQVKDWDVLGKDS